MTPLNFEEPGPGLFPDLTPTGTSRIPEATLSHLQLFRPGENFGVVQNVQFVQVVENLNEKTYNLRKDTYNLQTSLYKREEPATYSKKMSKKLTGFKLLLDIHGRQRTLGC